MVDLYAVPLSLSELTSWYSDGVARLLAARLVPLSAGGEAPGTNGESAARALPGYTDDFEVLYAVVACNGPLSIFEATGGQVIPATLEVRFEDVVRFHAATERGAQMLPSRVPPSVSVEGPLFAAEGRAEDTRRLRARADRGGRALLVIAGGSDDEAPGGEAADGIWNAISLRDREVGFPVRGGTFVDNLVNYDRHDPDFPRTSIGFVYDYGKIAFRSPPAVGEELREALKGMRAVLDKIVRDGETDVWQNYDRLARHFDRITALTDPSLPTAAALAFLQLREGVQRDGHLGDHLDFVVRPMRDAGLGTELGLALYLTGAFFGFPTFAQDYYAEVHSPAGAAPPSSPASSRYEPTVERVQAGFFDEPSERESALDPDVVLRERGSGAAGLKQTPLDEIARMIVATLERDGPEGGMSFDDIQRVITSDIYDTTRGTKIKEHLQRGLDLALANGDVLEKEGVVCLVPSV